MVVTRRVLAAVFAVLALVTTGCARLPESSADATPPTAEPGLGARQVVRDQVYATRDTGPLKLDLFLPAEPGPVPLVVYVHGGGWDAGFRTLDRDLGATESITAERLLERGYAVATVDYRLSGVAQAPAPIVDVGDAVRYLQENSGRWRLDGDRVLLWGASAGAHLVSQLAAVAGDPAKPGGGLTGLRGAVSWFGPTDMSAAAQVAHPELGDYAYRSVRQMLGCEPVQCPATADAASPMKNLSGDEPPFLIQHGTNDSIVPIDQSLDFAAELRKLGVPVEMHPYEGLDHGFGRGPLTPLITDTVVAFADTHLAERG
ncbi:alpha/beta hydrolase [Saccharopolyspora taberi]|uniref:Alpha/beta hydrolase n=1 Tax=Saccharopolyspora taberi TaxID=60895 RepID=A0ABN3VJS1_9PSEU